MVGMTTKRLGIGTTCVALLLSKKEGHTIARLFTDCFWFLADVLGMVLGKQRRGYL